MRYAFNLRAFVGPRAALCSLSAIGHCLRTPQKFDRVMLGGKADAIAVIDAQKLGLWEGLSFRFHQEYAYGDDANARGDGTVVPVNTASALLCR